MIKKATNRELLKLNKNYEKSKDIWKYTQVMKCILENFEDLYSYGLFEAFLKVSRYDVEIVLDVRKLYNDFEVYIKVLGNKGFITSIGAKRSEVYTFDITKCSDVIGAVLNYLTFEL